MKSVVFIVYLSIWFCLCDESISMPRAFCTSPGCSVCNEAEMADNCKPTFIEKLLIPQSGSCADTTLPLYTDSCNGPLQHNITDCQQRNMSWNPHITANFRFNPEHPQDVAYMELEWTSDLDPPQSYQLELSNFGGPICIAHVTKNVSKFIHGSVRYKKGLADNQLYVKLIPEGWCDGPRVWLPTPHDCYNTCPGNCMCRQGATDAGPRNIRVSSQCLSKTVHNLTIDWAYGENYYAPHPANTTKFGAGILDNNSKLLFSIGVIGKETRVHLEVEGLESNRIYMLGMAEYICGVKHRINTRKSFRVENCETFTDITVTTTSQTTPIGSHSSSATNSDAATTSNSHLMPLSSAITPSSSTNSSPYTSSSKELTSWLPTSQPEQKSISFLVIITPIVVALSLVIFILATVLILCILSRKCQVTPLDLPESKFCTKVLVLFSQASPRHEEECIMENVVKMLAEYSIESVVFDRPCVRGSIADWVFRNVESCCKVLLVCNKQFAEEWKKGINDDPVSSCSVVYVLHQVIDSYVRYDKAVLDKFAILYLKKKDCNLIENPYLRNMTSFLVDPHDSRHSQQLIRFITDTPTYAVFV